MIKVVSKYEQVKNILRKQILSGKFSVGCQIPPEMEMCNTFKVGRNTIREAVSSLVHEGLLVKIQGRGTFVVEKAVKSDRNTCALFIHAKGHLYENQSRILFREIQKQGCSSKVVDLSGFKENRNKIIQDVINSKPLGIVIDGFFSLPFDIFREMESKITNLCFINRYENDYTFRAAYILSDSLYGSYLATSHLLGLGHKKILLILPAHKLQEPPNPVYEHTEHFQIIQGYRKALLEYDIGVRDNILFDTLDTEESKKKLIDIMTDSDRPTAIFAIQDSRAKFVIDTAKEQGLMVPKDLAVVGYYNTPWTTMIEVPLTSVSTKEETIAKITAQKLIAGIERSIDSPPETIYIKPELVIRESCGASCVIPANAGISENIRDSGTTAGMTCRDYKGGG